MALLMPVKPTEGTLTVVMYHYVRPIAGSARPGIKGRELEEFRGQLAYLATNHTFTTVERVVASTRGGPPLPPDAAVLTFDDGYRDHADHVFPVLQDLGVQGAFFPPSAAILERVPLDVNKIHYVLSSGVDPSVLVAEVEEAVRAVSERGDLLEIGDYRRAHRSASRFDGPDVAYVKRMLQHALPADLRGEIVHQLFLRHVSTDIAGFADELYMTVEDLRSMIDGGMHVGLHGHSHRWLDRLSAAEQVDDIDRSLGLLDALGLERRGFTFCYPYGGYTAETVAALEARGCAAAFTTVVGRAPVPLTTPMEIPRLDTNDLPTDPDAPPPGSRRQRTGWSH